MQEEKLIRNGKFKSQSLFPFEQLLTLGKLFNYIPHDLLLTTKISST